MSDIPPSKFMLLGLQQEASIRDYLENGYTVSEIAEKEGLPERVVRSVITKTMLRRQSSRIAEEVKEALFEDKVPVLEAIGDMGLIALLQWIENFVGRGRHLKMATREASELSGLIEKLHNMYRLQLGKSTINVAVAIEHSAKSMDQILTELKKASTEGGDPFKDYPALPEKSGVTIDVTPEPEKVSVKAKKGVR